MEEPLFLAVRSTKKWKNRATDSGTPTNISQKCANIARMTTEFGLRWTYWMTNVSRI